MTAVAALLAILVHPPQATARPVSTGPVDQPSVSTTTSATKAPRPPVIDGRDDDDVWRLAPVISDFTEFQPTEGKAPRFRTEARVAYDAGNFYVFIRAFDPHPDSILQLLGRRDFRTASDQLKIVIDSYHDRRSGYEFAVNPAGVKRDYSISSDVEEDDAWDAVWDVGTTVDSLGWTAEFRIPLSQLRYAPGAANTFGFGIWRDIQRFSERVSWPVYRPSQAGFASQLGEVTGLEGLGSPKRLEVSPYAVAKNEPIQGTLGTERNQQFTAGADIKYGLGSNLTLDATVNPDFGQVEADPSVLNLSAFETFFQERRPFFVAGSGIFGFGVNCSQVNCNGENLFYSRRIGRRPQLRDDNDARSPTASTILGASKLTGRFPGGLTFGFLDAVTSREEGTPGNTIEPATNYAMVRAQQDYRNGLTGVGFALTAVNRSLDSYTEDVLRRSAYVGAVDFRHRFAKGRYQISGSFDFSRVAGTAAAITRTQSSPVHNYQRPDDGIALDTTRTTLTGDAQEIYFGKVGGGLIRFQSSFQRRSPGFEANDMGFLLRAGQESWNNWMGLNFTRPASFYLRGFWNFNFWQYWAPGNLTTERAVNTNAHFQLKNHWWLHAGGTLGQLGGVYCDNCARGGPAVREEPYISPWLGIESDDRLKIKPFLWLNYWRGEGGRGEFKNINPQVDLRVSSRFNASMGLSMSWNTDDWAYYGRFDTLGTHYTFAHLEQKTGSINARMDYTISTTLTLQVYASPFVSKGQYSNIRELNNPRAPDYPSRFQPYFDTNVTSNPAAFNFKQFNSNVVLRWEYRPGSTLFVVWGQAREGFDGAMGTRTMSGDFRDLFRKYPKNTFLVKASYWLNW